MSRVCCLAKQPNLRPLQGVTDQGPGTQDEGRMKTGIHPTYEDATITCACGNVIHTRSTVKDMQVNTCSACHPFYTGQATFIDSEGRVEQFMKRYRGKKKD